MLYRLELENFYSFRESTVVDLAVTRGVQQFPERFGPVFANAEMRTPKVVALFGANASGKSTILKALVFLAWFVESSFGHRSDGLPCERFNDEESARRPVRLAIEFGGRAESESHRDNGAEPPRYGTFRYELELATKDGAVASVASEALRFKAGGRGKWQRVFQHIPGRQPQGSALFSLAGLGRLGEQLGDRSSLVSALGQFAHEPSRRLIQAARSLVGNAFLDRQPLDDRTVAQYLAERPEMIAQLNHELQRLDVGIRAFRVERTVGGWTPFFDHEGLLQPLPLGLESQGTRSFLRIAPYLFHALARGGVAVIDELDLSIHPMVLPEIMRWFYDPARNPHDAQLWMACHSVSLLDELCKEEVVLCEKDRRGRSTACSLMDVQSIRRSDNLYKKYLGGVYGAVPHIG